MIQKHNNSINLIMTNQKIKTAPTLNAFKPRYDKYVKNF